MKILFFVPIGRTYVIMPPLGIGYLALIARREGFDVKILDCLKENMTYERFEEHLKKNPADIFGISMMTCNINSVKEHIKIIRRNYPNSIVILGGSGPSGDYENILNEFPEADFAFRGEAELGFKEFLKLLKNEEEMRDYSTIPNLIWRDKRRGNKIIINPWKVVNDLDTIEFPAWDLIDPRTYPEAPHGAFAKNFPIAPMVITRGCPFQCTFCSGKSVTGNVVRKRSIPNIIKEINYLVDKYGVKEIHIEDENFTLHKKTVMEFCGELIAKNIKISWACPAGVRLDTLDAEMLDLMQKSGCHSLAVGIEFGTEKIHQLTKKRLNLEIIKQKLDLLFKYNIKVTGFFLMGIPGETREDMLKTIKFAKSIKIYRAQFNNFMPLPGSELYNELKQKDKNFSIEPNHFFVHDVGFVPPGMTRQEVKKLQRKAYLGFYLRPWVIWQLTKEVRNFSHLKYLIKRFIDGLK